MVTECSITGKQISENQFVKNENLFQYIIKDSNKENFHLFITLTLLKI